MRHLDLPELGGRRHGGCPGQHEHAGRDRMWRAQVYAVYRFFNFHRASTSSVDHFLSLGLRGFRSGEIATTYLQRFGRCPRSLKRYDPARPGFPGWCPSEPWPDRPNEPPVKPSARFGSSYFGTFFIRCFSLRGLLPSDPMRPSWSTGMHTAVYSQCVDASTSDVNAHPMPPSCPGTSSRSVDRG